MVHKESKDGDMHISVPPHLVKDPIQNQPEGLGDSIALWFVYIISMMLCVLRWQRNECLCIFVNGNEDILT